jgi:hypothetical protein
VELINATQMQAGFTMGVEPSGRELLVIAVKGTFHLPATPAETMRLHETQVPLVLADVFYGDPAASAPKYEIDYAPVKRRCDLLLNASAHAPGGRPSTRGPVGVRVGDWSKSFVVVGDRVWQVRVSGIGASAPRAFTVMPITYDRAFGGTDDKHPDRDKWDAFLANPVGRGYHKHLRRDWVDGAPMPNTEESQQSVTSVGGDYRPMSFGVIGRSWQPRARFGGTYDQEWLDRVCPFLPADFDEQYYQSAPRDQQLPIPLGRQPITLHNLTADGTRSFTLPHFEAPVHVFPRKGGREDLQAQLDTIVIEPDEERLTMTWRVTRPLKRNMFEVAEILVGRKNDVWWTLRDTGRFPLPLRPVGGGERADGGAAS